MDDSTDNILEKIKQYQKSILKHSELRNDAKILSYISKLYDMPVTVAHLQDTGIGRTINSLRKYNGDVGTASKAIVYKWKNMVAREEEAEEAALEATSRQSQSSVDESENTPPPTPPSVDRKKRKHSTDDKDKKKSRSHEKRHKRESPERLSKSRDRENEAKNKSHHRKDEKRDSHKSSHSNSKVKEVSDRYRKEDKTKHDKKRKSEEDRSPAKKKKYETNDSDSDESNRLLIQENSLDSTVLSDDNVQRDSATAQENSRENTQSPVESTSSSPRKKSHKSRDKESSKKEQNGSSNRNHRDKPSSNSKKEKDTKQSSSSNKSSENQEKKLKPLTKAAKIIHNDNGIDSGSGASFAEALGMITPSSSGSKAVFKKKTASSSPTPSTSTTVKSAKTTKSPSSSSVSSSQNVNVDLLSPNTKLEPLDLNIIPPIPEITTNYKPLTISNYSYDSFSSKMKNMTEEEALSVVISSKTQRTKVYSGNKTYCGIVPSLFQLCVRILQDNIDALEYTGGVPYEILKPVLERATANQLLNTEYFNPYLIEESDILWEKHCRRECRGQQKQELESWRDMYLRCRDEREAKLKTLTTNIKQSIDKSVPVRQTKLAYVDNAKPPRNIARKQAKYGTNVVTKPFMTPSARLNAIASGSGEKIHVPTPRVSASAIKPKKAPLMQKTLALIKSRFRR